VHVQFFAQLRDLAGASALDVDLPEGSSVTDLLKIIYSLEPRLREHDATTLVGAGVDFVDRNYQIRPNENIAIMPPVQGG